MSNLIKSGRVIDVGIPVNIGLSCDTSELTKVITEKKKIATENVAPKNISNTPQPPKEPVINKEEIINKYMDEAKQKAQELYNSELKRAHDEGVASAKEEADNIIKKAEEDYQVILDEIVKLKEDVVKEYKEEMKNLEKDVLDLALSIAEKIINYEVDKSDDYVLGIVKDALDRVMSKKDVTLKLSTADYYTVLSNKKYLVANVKGFGEIEIIQDESMEPGTCIVDTPLGVIDGSLQVRMDNIQKEIEKMLAE